MTEFEQVGLEIIKFMRGKYRLDEVAGMYYDIPCLKFRQGKKTIVSINLHKDYYDFQIILGKAEREKFEAIRHELPIEIQKLYDSECMANVGTDVICVSIMLALTKNSGMFLFRI